MARPRGATAGFVDASLTLHGAHNGKTRWPTNSTISKLGMANLDGMQDDIEIAG